MLYDTPIAAAYLSSISNVMGSSVAGDDFDIPSAGRIGDGLTAPKTGIVGHPWGIPGR